VALKCLPVLITALILAGCGPSPEELTAASSACLKFYKEERLPHYWQTNANDTWVKDGKIVVELAVRESENSKSYRPRLCVYDKEGGRLSIPALIEQARWQK
jgi:hypothetical protein